mmetsp:Transcript_402/g.723  ORF Transcript_402/g.723 Transcript_402/m.723 type:complete len:480 (-) Transcript_402:195-1634(-)
MPLTRRLEKEILPEWRLYSVPYKELQREAEDLVGNENEELQEVFKFHLLHAAEEASTFYEAKQAQVRENFEAVTKQIDVCAQVHIDRAAKHPAAWTPSASPTQSTDCLWSTWTLEETTHELAQFFEMWVRSTKAKRGVILLSDFVDDSFMSQLEEGALRGALKEWLRLLALVDQVRSFAVLNVMAVTKLIQRHCAADIAQELQDKVGGLAVFGMRGMGEVMGGMEQTAQRLALCLHKDYAWSMDLDSASHWSLHICPFCAKSVLNGVMLEPGRPACWHCAVSACKNAIVSCPLTRKDADLRTLKLERVLGTFLRRYFPCAHKTAPGSLLGNFVKEDVTPKSNGHGILSMMKSVSSSRVPSVPEAPDEGHVSLRKTRKKRPAPPSMDLSYLDAAVSKMLQRLNESAEAIDLPMSGASSHAPDMDRRDRSSSLPCPPRAGELSLMIRPHSSGKAGGPKSPGGPGTPSMRGAVRDLASLVAS